MKYTKKDLGSFGLHLIQTDKFKTITVRLVFHSPIIKEEITKRNVLADIFLQSSEKYDSRRKLTIQAEDLYAADIVTNNQRLGNYLFTSINLQVLQDKYTEEGNFEKSLEFLNEILFHPDVKQKAFKEDKLNTVKTTTTMAINSIKEDSSSYSLIRMAEAYDSSSPLSYRMCGYIEDLEKITPENLYECYQNMIENDFVDIFVVGDFDNKEMTTLIKKYFKFKKIKKKKDSYYLKNKKARKRRLFAKETADNTQSKLAIACSINPLTDYEKNYSLVLANLILGGGTDSKLFQNVREEHSLCYSIHSFANKLDNILVISAGIDKNNYSQTVELITKNLLELKKGHFNEKDIEIAKEFYQTSLDEFEESENHLINEFLQEELLEIDPIEERAKRMQKVRKQDIVKVFKKINMDTVFLLEGTKHEEE